MTHQSDSVNPPRVEFQVHLKTGHRGRKHLKKGARPKKWMQPNENLPRLTRLLALAHRWNRLIDEGVVGSHAEIASLMGISRARVTQILDLLYLAPDIQEELLMCRTKQLTSITLPERSVRGITRIPIWAYQRKHWQGLRDYTKKDKSPTDTKSQPR